jgi:hypothetical protein
MGMQLIAMRPPSSSEVSELLGRFGLGHTPLFLGCVASDRFTATFGESGHVLALKNITA